jgi:hypothetical protein
LSKQNVNTMEKKTVYFDENGTLYPYKVQSILEGGLKFTASYWDYHRKEIELDVNTLCFYIFMDEDSEPLSWEYEITYEFDLIRTGADYDLLGGDYYDLDYFEVDGIAYTCVEDLMREFDNEKDREEIARIQDRIDQECEKMNESINDIDYDDEY